ncbi:hypothetical protein [Vibrio alginolyticus]|uniref:hypothetical protein n=1 Tax=Vibrio alginolyticus TaxID=663 RepID=UPI0022794948|nr:hypothetical protein [Vibrio alginolyticus]WAE58083.1 hypothetical protein OPR71_20665 [Vibrio alginolyticus]
MAERIIGFRVEPKVVNFCILELDRDEMRISGLDCIKVPAALHLPEQLKYIRNTVLDVISEFEVTLAALKVVEGNSQNNSDMRMYIQGVIQESFSSSAVKRYYVGRKQSIASKLKITIDEYDEFVQGKKQCELVENWAEYATSK